MTQTAAVLLLAALAATVLLWQAARVRRHRRQEARKGRREEALKERVRRREAHYMQNFWSYDGSVQEEFRE